MKKGKFMLAALLGLYASTSFTMADPALVGGYYQIGTYEDLVWFEQKVNSSTSLDQTNAKINAELTADIIAPEGETWNSPIGKQSSKGGFQGTFNGKGHKIENLQIEPTGSADAGLFGIVKSNGHILNLSIVNAVIGKGNSSIALGGGFAHTLDGTISNCCFIGTITTNSEVSNQVGGICGVNRGTIEGCYTDGNFTGRDKISGIAGEIGNAVIKSCYTNAKLSAMNIYPIAYKTTTEATFEKCYHSAKTQAADAAKDADFQSGMIAYTLNDGNDGPFKQNIGTDELPSFEGKIVYRYQNCDKQFKYTNDESMKDKVLLHSWSAKNEAQTATCTKDGNYAYYTCLNEPDVYYKEDKISTFKDKDATIIKALGHAWNHENVKPATCEEDGMKEHYTCDNEPGVYYDATKKITSKESLKLDKMGHQLEEHTLEGTITCTDGDDPNYIYYTCKNDPTEFFAKDKVTRINNPQQAIDDVTGHIWGEWEYKNTEGDVDTYVRTCQRNGAHTEKTTSPHAWGEWVILEDEPDHITRTHSCSSAYGSHSQTETQEFPVEEVIYYSQLTGERDTTFRASTEFIPVDTKNDLLFVGKESTISGNNVVKGEECNNLVITYNVDFSTPVDFEAENLSYTRTLGVTDTTIAFTLPYEVKTSDFNGYLYEFYGYIEEKHAIRFTLVESGVAVAGQPYLLYRPTTGKKSVKLHKNLTDVVILANQKARTVMNNGFQYFGTFKKKVYPIGDGETGYLIYPENTIQKITSNITLNPFKAGLKLTAGSSPAPARPSLGLIFDDELTGVITIDAEGNLTTGNVDVYDMTGRLVRKNVESATCLQGLKPGIYVVNGEKFVKTANE